ncbi:hypothetical protein N869_05820 [Cellulomonas bogoriensis 69B4 = DSM 16987]|uniref:DUF7847 domain-containing protein n=1 Tax=Cellulomonas bogoriensis 69B4 = DSM 16987 TaxID=1386082 RepID=A0A0A0BND6_9CELL|nr:hypothetical protein [Cellulomonas bogoriensis]KGM10013.1 hypothetical protein N869_05820 [Cellulomonas bogoriensis 69B4 = DSM 16987]
MGISTVTDPNVPESRGSENQPPPAWGPGYTDPSAGFPPPPAGPPGPGPAQGAPGYGQPQHGAPGYGQPQYGQPQYGQPQYGQPQYGQPGGAPGYRPPPVQRGIVPLRPLGLGEVLDGAFRAIRANPAVMFGISAVVITLTVLLDSLVQWYLFSDLGQLMMLEVEPDAEVVLGELVGLAGGSTLSMLVSIIATTLLTGILILSVSRSVIGQRISVAAAWQRTLPRILPLLGLTLLVILLLFLVPAVVIVGAVLLFAAEAWAAAFGLMVLGSIASIVWMAWIAVRTLLSTAALMLEEQGVLGGFRRGWELSRGSFWRLLGYYLLVSMVVGVVASIIVFPAAMIPAMLQLDPLGDPVAIASSAVATIIASVLTTPFSAAVFALLYIDLRIRREGLDVELARAAENAATDASGTTRT